MAKADLTAQRLRELLRYDPETGDFIWITRPKRVRLALGVAGTTTIRGYRQIWVLGACFYSHRLAWLWMTGEWPPEEIDHINGIRSDNRWSNLRVVNRAGNMQNLHRGRLSKTGFKGVFLTENGKFRASISVCNVVHNLGRFATAEAAHAAYMEAKARLHIA